MRRFLESKQQSIPAGVVTQRENGAVYSEGVRIGHELRRVGRIRQVAFKELGRLQDKAAIDINGIRRVYKGEETTGTVIVKKFPGMRVRKHPLSGIHRHTLVSDHRIIEADKERAQRPKMKKVGSRK